MKYVGKLFGQIGRTRGYFDTGKTSEDWDALEARAERAEAELREMSAEKLRWSLFAINRGDDLQRAEAEHDATREMALSLAKELDEAQAELAAERARLDWLLLDVVSRFDDAYNNRAAIDSAMMEGVAPTAPKSAQNAHKLNQTGANRPASPHPS